MPDPSPAEAGLLRTLVGDGRPLLVLSALALVAFGAFALFLGATGHFLPHDTAYLGMTSRQLCDLHACRIVHFMVPDRVSFGGVLVAIGVAYLWLATFPLKAGERWAWWTLTGSAAAGFLSFLSYLGYGYLDTWHGLGTLALLPLVAAGLALTRRAPVRSPRVPLSLATRAGQGRVLLVLCAAGIAAAGLTISAVGTTLVFVPQDLEFMRLTRAELAAVNPRLVPLIAHDRAGFGGALLSCGAALLPILLYRRIDRGLAEALAIVGVAGFGAAVGVHPAIGYTSLTHLGPAVLGAVAYAVGLALAWPRRT
ncbi:MAG: hypothetical protein ABW221_23610 [Vicinamibacteria bacterium]